MKLKISRSFKTCILLLLTLFISLQLKVSRLILFFLIFVIYCITENINSREKIEYKTILMIQNVCRIVSFLLAIIFVIQVLLLELNIREIAQDFGTLTCVFIGFILASVGIKSLKSFDAYLKSILLFMISFSVYYLFDVLLNGLPEGRNSALGIVSSNFCCTILYLNYPIIFYYLFSRNKKSAKHHQTYNQACYLALILSLIVIIISGSRTALGAVVLMLGQMIFLKQQKLSNKIKYIVIVIAGLIAGIVAYINIPNVRELLARALEALKGKSTLSSNVRQLIWADAIEQFNNGNRFWGSGSGVVISFERSAHNLFYEILLCAGFIGLTLFFVAVFTVLVLVFIQEHYAQRFFTIMIIVSNMIVAYVQPFYSTSYICGILTWMSIFVLLNDSRGKQI